MRPIYFAIGAGVIIMLVAMYGMVVEGERWAKFRDEHNCKVVSKGSSTVIPIIQANGGISIVPVAGSTSWLCDDGITYTR